METKYSWIISSITLLVVTLLFAAVTISAKPGKAPQETPRPSSEQFTLPATARRVTENLYYLGKAVDNGREVEGFAHIDYKDVPAKPETDCGDGVCEPSENKNNCSLDCGGGNDDDGSTDTSSCYGFLSKEAKWKQSEPWIVNSENTRGLSDSFVIDNLAADINKWEGFAGSDILGDGSSTNDKLLADTNSPDDNNEVYFADIQDSGAIGVTIVWGIFSGPPFGRELVEWDQIYDDVDYDWSSTGEAGKMDFENIATHELGHSVGLADLYTSSCTEETMFGYADFGETKKRDLNPGDVTGIKELYQ
jgi:hypothetical protein